MLELDLVLKAIHEVLPDVLMTQEGLRVYAVDVISIINRAFSDIVFLRIKTSNGERKLVLKKTVHHPANRSVTTRQNQAVVEYDILCKLYPKFLSVPCCRVPKPILVIPEHEAYVMDFVDGRLLGDLFFGAKYFVSKKSFNELIEFYYLCGVWLKKLQEFTGIRKAGVDAFSNMLDRCEQKLDLIEGAQNPICPKNLVSHVRCVLDEQLKLVKDEDILVTGRHGDFGSWNIMAGANVITVFDFLGFGDDLLPIDILKMLVNFEIEKTYLFFSNDRIEFLKNAFLKGYGELPQISRPILTISEMLHRVCSLCANVTESPMNLRRRVEQQILLRTNIAWIMNGNRKLLWPDKVQC